MNIQPIYQPIPQTPADIIQDQADQQCKCCFHCFCWFFQITVWGLIIASIIIYFVGYKSYTITLGI